MTTPGFRPTHVVPQNGMPAWEAPDPSRPTVDLDPLLPVQLLERQGDWGHVLCFNGWSAWVDGRRLVAVPQDPPAADGPLTRSADPRPLLSRTQEALARYRSAVEDLAGGSDLESFQARTHGLRIGVVVEGESVWLYDAAHGHWVYADGTRATTYATDETPRSDPVPHPAPARTPTRVVPAEAVEKPPRADRPTPPAETPPTRAAPPDPRRAASREAPEPTRVVSPESSESPRAVPSEAPEATRFVPPAAPDPTRVVSPEAPEPLRAGSPQAQEPPQVASPETPQHTRAVSPEAPEPTRGVSEAPPTRVVSPEGDGEAAPDEEAGGAPEAPPTRVVGAEPTRIVSPEGDVR
ncbi:hypothetical protein QF034_007874 [Streptomyces africanus]|uniref:Uncharacterized protein n=1 Tax=Streptomyces africanus TaxID=231024 RepID=A0ABU0R1W1_9ACTN|nr:hypothetical protein [Streptomyces africanus]